MFFAHGEVTKLSLAITMPSSHFIPITVVIDITS